MIVLGSGAFGSCIGHEDEAFIDGLNVFKKEILQSNVAPSTTWAHSEKALVRNQEEGPHPTMLVPWPGISSLQNCEKQISVIYKQLSLWYFVTAAWTD